MVVFPTATPVTIPVFGSIVATEFVLLLQVPPDISLLRLMVDPMHTEVAPLMVPAFGTGFTVIGADTVADPQTFETV